MHPAPQSSVSTASRAKRNMTSLPLELLAGRLIDQHGSAAEVEHALGADLVGVPRDEVMFDRGDAAAGGCRAGRGDADGQAVAPGREDDLVPAPVAHLEA